MIKTKTYPKRIEKTQAVRGANSIKTGTGSKIGGKADANSILINPKGVNKPKGG